MTQYHTTANRRSARDLMCVQCHEVYSPNHPVCYHCLFRGIYTMVHAKRIESEWTPERRHLFNTCFKGLKALADLEHAYADDLAYFYAPDVSKGLDRDRKNILGRCGYNEGTFARDIKALGYSKLAWMWGV